MAAFKVKSRADIESWPYVQALEIKLALLYNASAIEAWSYDATSTVPAADDFVIIPRDKPQAGRWIRQSDYAAIGLALHDVARAAADAVGPGTISSEQLTADIVEAITTASANITTINRQIDTVVQQLVAADAGNAANIQQVVQSLTSQTGALQADYINRFGTVTTTLAAYAYAVQAVQAMFGADYSAAMLRMEVQTPPAGYIAKIALSASASVGGATGLGGIVILLKVVDSQIVSTIAFIANETMFLLPDGTLVGLVTADGWIDPDRVQKGSISTGEVYYLGDSVTTKGSEDTTSPPPDGTEVAIGNGKSVPYYSSTVLATDGIPAFKTDPTASLVEVEARFVFRVQTGAGAETKAGIEYWTGSAWAYITGSDDAVYTSNTNSIASLTPKAPLPAGTTYWRPRIWNTTGNTIWMRRVRGYVTRLVK